MNREEILGSKDRALMEEYSGRCCIRIKHNVLYKVLLSFFHDFMKANVEKEIQKDRLIIAHTVKAFQAGRKIDESDVEAIFEKTKEIDRRFVDKVSYGPVTMRVRYEDIEDVRKKRIRVLAWMVMDLLGYWQNSVPFSTVIKTTYSRERFEERLAEMLHLYNLETRLLSNSVKLFPPVSRSKDKFAEKLYVAMEEETKNMTLEISKMIYGEGDSA